MGLHEHVRACLRCRWSQSLNSAGPQLLLLNVSMWLPAQEWDFLAHKAGGGAQHFVLDYTTSTGLHVFVALTNVGGLANVVPYMYSARVSPCPR